VAPRQKKLIWIALVGALLVSAVLKTWLVLVEAVPFNADEAIVALMARHILSGARPAFFYGQAYMGSLDAWLVAGAFALFGQQVWAIRLVQGLLHGLTVLTTAWLGKSALGSWGAGVTAAWLLAVPAVNVTLYTTASLGGYGEALLIGNLVLICTLRIASKTPVHNRQNPWLWLAWGFLAGLGLWTFGLTLVYSLPAAGLLALSFLKPQLPKLQAWLPFLAIGGALAGSAPWWGYALGHGFGALLGELGGGNIAGVEGLVWPDRFIQHLVGLTLLGGSVLLGLRPPWEVRWLALPLLPLALAVWMGAIIHAARSWRSILAYTTSQPNSQESPGLQPPAGLLLLGVVLCLALGFLFTPFGADPSGRYFLPLAVPLALLGAGWIHYLARRLGPAAYGLVAVVLAFNLWGTVQGARQNPPGLTTQFNPVTQVDMRFTGPLIDFLSGHGLSRGYTNYWVAYPLAFLSQEQLIFTPRLPYHPDFRYTPRDDRYPPYQDLVARAWRPAYITTHHPELDQALRDQFIRSGLTWQEAAIGDFRVFYDLSGEIPLVEP
jgi:4-amino-4-deoxy-L-arabinose transferase-like glycosyltransferase